MSDKNQVPKRGTKEHQQWIKDRLAKEWEKISERGPVDFDECGVISGSKETFFKTDAELFPDELEEYKPEERKPKLVPKFKDVEEAKKER